MRSRHTEANQAGLLCDRNTILLLYIRDVDVSVGMVNCVVSCDLYYEFVVIRCTQRRRVVVSGGAQNRDAYVKKSEEPPN